MYFFYILQVYSNILLFLENSLQKEKASQLDAKGLGFACSPDRTIFATFV